MIPPLFPPLIQKSPPKYDLIMNIHSGAAPIGLLDKVQVLSREKFKVEYQTSHPSKLYRALLYPSFFPPAIPSHLGMKKIISKIKYQISCFCLRPTPPLVLAAPQVGGALIKKLASLRHKTQKFSFFGGLAIRFFLAKRWVGWQTNLTIFPKSNAPPFNSMSPTCSPWQHICLA